MKRIRFLLLTVGLFAVTMAYSQNEKFKALFIYNFTNYIDWAGMQSNAFVITILGSSPITSELESISKIKKITNLPIEVKTVSSVAEISKSHIVFVPSNKKKFIPELSQAFAGKQTLIITDGANSDFGINFVDVDSKQSFQISKSNIEAHNLKVNTSLFSLGILVK